MTDSFSSNSPIRSVLPATPKSSEYNAPSATWMLSILSKSGTIELNISIASGKTPSSILSWFLIYDSQILCTRVPLLLACLLILLASASPTLLLHSIIDCFERLPSNEVILTYLLPLGVT